MSWRRFIDAVHELLDIPLEDAEQFVRSGGLGIIMELSPVARLELCAMLGVPLYARAHSQGAPGAGNNCISQLAVPTGGNVCAVILDAVYGSSSLGLVSGILDGAGATTVVSGPSRGVALDRRPGSGVFAADGVATVTTGHRAGSGGGQSVYVQNLAAATSQRVVTLEGAVLPAGRSALLYNGTANQDSYFSWRWYEVGVGVND